MTRILLAVEQKTNRRLLFNWLEEHYQVAELHSEHTLDESWDLVLLDGPALTHMWERLRARKEAEQPVFLPVLLATSRQDVGLARRYLWQSIDELIISPVETVDLLLRVETLLRARRLSIQLKRFSEDQEAFIHAMTHDLRAPLRAVRGFSHALIEDYMDELGTDGQHYVNRVQSAADEMQTLVDSLLDFSRLGRGEIHLQSVSLNVILDTCLVNLQDDIRASNADVNVARNLPDVQANPTLLNIAMTNLISNAMKYVPPGVCPRVVISADVAESYCRIKVQDNGIGISEQGQVDIFTPFVRLHGVEEYPGVGLGLPTVRKAVELMGGRMGVISAPGDGSTFWFELQIG